MAKPNVPINRLPGIANGQAEKSDKEVVESAKKTLAAARQMQLAEFARDYDALCQKYQAAIVYVQQTVNGVPQGQPQPVPMSMER